MRNISRKVLLIAILIELVLGVALIFATTKVPNNLNKVFLVITVVDFILLTFTIQALGFKSFKPKRVKYPTKDYKSSFEYNELASELEKNGFKLTKRNYGNTYLLIDGKTAIKVSLIDDYNTYFDGEEAKDSNEPTKGLDKCEKFVGIEIFKEIDEANLDKLPLFTIQGKNVYFTALLYQLDKSFKCLNYELPNDDFKTSFDKAMNILNMQEEDDLNVEQ